MRITIDIEFMPRGLNEVQMFADRRIYSLMGNAALLEAFKHREVMSSMVTITQEDAEEIAAAVAEQEEDKCP